MCDGAAFRAAIARVVGQVVPARRTGGRRTTAPVPRQDAARQGQNQWHPQRDAGPAPQLRTSNLEPPAHARGVPAKTPHNERHARLIRRWHRPPCDHYPAAGHPKVAERRVQREPGVKRAADIECTDRQREQSNQPTPTTRLARARGHPRHSVLAIVRSPRAWSAEQDVDEVAPRRVESRPKRDAREETGSLAASVRPMRMGASILAKTTTGTGSLRFR